ncbi:MAG: glycoside hydrolase family 5 protein [Lentisphaerae bacterium]|nr:glycoside hydrolase family 5 protein [Lentisphaerota bacterium]
MKLFRRPMPLLSAVLLSCSAVFAGYKKTDLLYDFSFDTPESLTGWSDDAVKYYRAGQGAEQSGVMYFKADSDKHALWISTSLDPAKLEGMIQLEAVVRGQGLQAAKQPYWGTKLMLTISRGGKQSHPEPPRSVGSYDWRTVYMVQNILPGTDKVSLSICIQHAIGEFWVDSVRIYRCVETDEVSQEPPPVNEEAKLVPRGDHRGATYRGFMSGHDMSDEAFATLAAWKVNLIRYQLHAGRRDISTPEKYLAWLDEAMAELDVVLGRCARHGIKVAIDLHTGPGTIRTAEASNILVDSEANMATLEEAWRKLAGHYRGNALIYGYDLLNEPRVSNYMRGVENPWQLITERLVAVIRAIDPTTPIITEPNFRTFKPVNDPHIIYSPHFYSPHSFTHQGVGDRKVRWSYPGWINGVYWDKEQLRLSMAEVINFQRRHQVPIFVGEFSAINWAKGADKYLQDSIELFEEYGWDWTYHAFREWDAWSIEHDGYQFQKVRKSDDNPRKQVLLKALEKNAGKP